MYYVPIQHGQIELGMNLACRCKSYDNLSTGKVTYLGKYGLTLTDDQGSVGILYTDNYFYEEHT